jgi:hypothetical protein
MRFIILFPMFIHIIILSHNTIICNYKFQCYFFNNPILDSYYSGPFKYFKKQLTKFSPQTKNKSW